MYITVEFFPICESRTLVDGVALVAYQWFAGVKAQLAGERKAQRALHKKADRGRIDLERLVGL